MRKLYKLKRWYSVEDASSRFALTLGEPIPEKEIYQLIADGHIAAYWNIPRRMAREVSPITRLHREGDPVFEALRQSGKLNEKCKVFATEALEPQSDFVQPIEGLFKIDTEYVGAAKEWLKSIAANRECDYTSLDGTLLIGEDGRCWQLMAPFPLNEYAEKFESKSPWNHPDNFYPEFDLPEVNEIVISKAEIEYFEGQFAEPIAPEKPVSTHERNTLLVLIAALCAKAGIDPKARGAAGQLVKLANVDPGVVLDDGTVLDKLRQIPDAVGARLR